MQQLSGLDASFLYLETPEMPMHVGALHVFELPTGYKGRFVNDLRKHMAARLPAAPVLRRRVWWMPLNLANPAWVDAEPDLKRHIVEIKLPKSAKTGDGRLELEAAVGQLHPVLLDRSRPLWKFHVLEGLAPSADGHKRVGLYTQLHHAAVDGQAAVALANAILDIEPDPPPLAARVSTRKKVFRLGMTEMLRGALASQAQKVAAIVRELPATVGTLGGTAKGVIGRSALFGGAKGKVSNLTLAPRTALNASATAGRAFATVSLPLADLKALGRAHGATVNDMVLMLCSTALRRYFAKRKLLPRKSLVAGVPISLREKGDTSADNQASMSLISLGTHLADPLARLHHIQAATSAMKSTMGDLKSVLPTDFPSIGIPWLIEAATALYGKARVADRIPQLANLVISNVPGPPVPLYLAGARMLSNHPSSIVVHGLGLNITVQSYHRSLDFGLMADAQAMPDVRELAEAIEIAYGDIQALPLPGEGDAAPARESTVGRARRAVTGAVSGALGGAVNDAVSGAMNGVVNAVVGQAVASVTGRGNRLSKTTSPPTAVKKPQASTASGAKSRRVPPQASDTSP